MQGYHKKYTLHCEALSPIHIGSGESLSRWEYVVIGGVLYYTTDEFWDLLRSKYPEKFNNFINRSLDSNDTVSLSTEWNSISKLLADKELLRSKLEKSSISFKPFTNSKTSQSIIREVNRFAGSSSGYYIPGSSIKGALRGAYEIMKVDAEYFQTKGKDFLNSYEKRKNAHKDLKKEFSK